MLRRVTGRPDVGLRRAARAADRRVLGRAGDVPPGRRTRPAGTATLVARVMPDAAIAAKETVFQAEVAAQGFPTPAVLALGGPDDGVGPGVHGHGPRRRAAAARGSRRRRGVGELPSLGPPAPGDAGHGSWPTAPARPGAGACPPRRRRVASARDWTRCWRRCAPPPSCAAAAISPQPRRWLRGPPAPAGARSWCATATCTRSTCSSTTAAPSRCWTGPRRCWHPATYDLGFTSLVLAEPPLVVPVALRPLVGRPGRWLSRRFVAAYDRAAARRRSTPRRWGGIRAWCVCGLWSRWPGGWRGDHRRARRAPVGDRGALRSRRGCRL